MPGKKRTTVSMGSEAERQPARARERDFPLTRRNFLTYRGKITSGRVDGSERENNMTKGQRGRVGDGRSKRAEGVTN